jgi:hypothetical protein
MISRSGDSFIQARYAIKALESGYVVTLRDLSHNGELNCQGLTGDFVIQNTPSESYVEIAGDQMNIYESPRNRDRYLIFRKQR